MKKFLSVLLALAVAFTFTFGSTMSAFAEDTAYDKDTANALLDYAYTQATATSYSVDYDGKYAKTDDATKRVDSNGTVLDDLTVFTIKAEYMQKAIDAAYAGSVLTTGTSTVAGVGVSGTFSPSMTDAQKAANADAFAVKNGLITLATTTYLTVAEKAAFDEYKAYLAGLVDTVDISAYTDTNYKTNKHTDSEGELAGYLAKDGVRYDTSAEAAAATKAWAKAAIAAATYNVAGEETPEADVAPKEWKTTYANLYAKIFGDAKAIAVKENKDDALVDSLVTSLTYVLGANDYATKKSEAAADADAALKQAEAKATLNKVVSAFEYNDSYKTAMDPAIAAYKETITYLIENDSTMPRIIDPMAVTYDTTNKVYKVNGTDYIAICDAAAKLRADAATAKSNCAITKTPYDEETAKEDLDAQLLKAYKGQDAAITYFGDTAYTASQKAALKKDYSAAQEAGDVAGYYTWDGKSYYAKEWEVIKAAVDAYNAAIDAATTVADKEVADKAYAAATTEKLAPVKDTVDATINSTKLNKLLGYIGNYFTMVKGNYNTAAKNSDDIYISWDDETWKNYVDNADVITWIIAKGARTQAEAEALYSDACKVIDAYKSLDAAKNEAAAVKAQIAALPNPVALTDKDAVFAAKDAYDALVGDVQKFVTNYSTLKDDLTAVQKLDKTNIDLMIKALPATTAVTAADRDAIINVKTAVDAYNTAIDDEYYTGSKITNWSESTYMQKLANAEFKAAKDAYKALEVKYSADALTAEDADAVAAAKKALDDFIANWLTTENNAYYSVAVGNDPIATYEKTLDKMDAVVAAAIAEEAWTATDVKASLFDSSRKLTIWRTSKTSIRVTSVGSVADIKDHGYTVEYKFYKKAPGATSYKLVKTTSSNKYTYTNLKKGTNKFQVKVVVKDADGKVVASKWTYYRAAKIK